jgi:choline kinase
MNTVSEAVILMAGSGSRLSGSDETFLKPLVSILGRPLVCYTIDALIGSGINKINFIVGYQGDRLRPAIEQLVPSKVEFSFIENPDWQKQNGISLLAAGKHVTAPFLLTMGDHLFDKVIVDLLLKSADVDFLNVAVDRKIDSVFDLDDAMKVQTRGDRIVTIAKNLPDYDAIDTGLFVCPMEIFAYLERAKRDDDCSLADGVRLMAADSKVRAIDIGAAWWQDVDTPEMLANAEKQLRSRRDDHAMANAGPDRGDTDEN